MLHATARHGKSTLYKRYLGERDGEERRVCEEDEITSTVFGPLDFLCPTDGHRFWQRVLEAAGHANFLPGAPPSKVSMDMWAHRKAVAIEPDVVITMDWADGVQRILLIELKWEAGLSDNQLQRQWQDYLENDAQRDQALHLFIAKTISNGVKARATKDVWQKGNSLVLLPWLKIRSALGEFSKEASPLGRWAKLADQFLERVRIRRFGGFNQLFPCVCPCPNLPLTLFWHPYTYTGWAACATPPPLPDSIPNAIFFADALGAQ